MTASAADSPPTAQARGGLAAVRRTRGKSRQKNWHRAAPVAVIALELDLSADVMMRRRLEQHWSAVFRLRRAVQRDAGSLCRAYLAAPHERDTAGPKAVRERLGLDRNGIEGRAKTHMERSGWMRHHFTKATALHMADEVRASCDRFLFPDASGHRHGAPNVGSWWNFGRIPGRARSHTKPHPTWETYRLVGSLQGHLDSYATRPGWTVADATAVSAKASVFAQPKHLTAPDRPDGGWWAHQGALAIVYTGLPAGDLVLPVRLPQGAGQFNRLAHFLGSPDTWHKIDLVRTRDRRAPGGWRHQAHLIILGAGWVSLSTAASRASAPMDRRGGVDGNVSNLAVASIPASGTAAPVLATSYVTITAQQKAVTEREHRKARGRQRALDRSRRASNTRQYHLSRRQLARADRRAAAGLAAKMVDVPCGARLANAAGIPTQAYRRDNLSRFYRAIRADHAAAASAAAHRKIAYARQTAQAIVAVHGPHLVCEDVDIRTWMHRWGRGIAAFTPGRMLAALATECTAVGGALVKAGTRTTALSQHCLCGERVKKPLAQRWHACHCGIEGDRDIVSAVLGAAVTHTNPADPASARIDTGLREHARQLVLAGQVQNIPVTREYTAQQEGPVRSTVRHNPTPGTGRDGSHPRVASAGQGERPAQPRHRPLARGRRRTERTSHTPTIHKPPGSRINP